MSSMSTPSVEVKCLETFAYYPAFLRDYDQAAGQVLVAYPGAWKKDEWVALENVRPKAPEHDVASFQPQAGEVVEAQAKSSDDEPYSWWKATVKTVRGDFYMISYSSWEDEFNEILEKEMLRPYNRAPALKSADLKKLELPIPKDLHLDERALAGVVETSGALSVHVDPRKQVLVTLGNSVSVKRAQLLAGMMFKHLGEIQRLTERKLKYQNQLELVKSKLNEGHVETFTVQPASLIGLVIGVNGKNIKRVEKMPGVINVNVDSQKSKVQILAKTEEEAKAAREQLEFIEQRFPILRSQTGRVVGKSFSNMTQIERDSGVVRIKLDSAASSSTSDDPTAKVDLIIVGTKETVADALLLLNRHLEFIDTVNDLNNEVRQLELAEGGGTDGHHRGGQRGARGPRPQGNRAYSGNAAADFPPLQASQPQHQQRQKQQRPASVVAPTAASASAVPASTSAAAASPAAADENAEERKERKERGGRGRRGQQQRSGEEEPRQRREREPKQQQQQASASASAAPAAAAATSPAAASPSADGAAATEASRRGGDRQRGRGGRGQREPRSNDQATATAATPTTGDASTPASAAPATQAPKPQRERKPREPRQPKAAAAGDATATTTATASGDAAAAGSPVAGSPDAAAGSKPKSDRRRNERRPRQPAGDASAAAPTAASPTSPAPASSPAPAAASAAPAPSSSPQ